MQSYDDIISFVYSHNGVYFFKRLYQEVEQMRRGSLPLTGSHQIEELDMTLSDALNLAVSAAFAIQTEFLEKTTAEILTNGRRITGRKRWTIRHGFISRWFISWTS